MDPVLFTYLLLKESATSGAESLYQVFSSFLTLAIVVMVLISSAVGYIICKYRASNREGEVPQIHGNLPIETSLAVLTLGVGGFLFYLTLTTMLEINKPVEDDSADLLITGHQWWWEVEYLDEGVTTANEIHLPTDEELVIKLKTADVIHSFWVPALGRKMDLVSGNTNYLQFEIDEPGIYTGACSEFCGAAHAWMRIRVIAQPKEEFEQWIARKSQPAGPPIDSMAVKGRQIFDRYTCGNCHSIKGTQANGEIGPPLTHLASRKTLLAGRLVNTPENLHRWLSHPQKVKPGAHMPKFILTKGQIDALVAYLEGLE